MKVFLVECEKTFFDNSHKEKNIEEIFGSMEGAENYIIKNFSDATLVHHTDYSRVYTLWADFVRITLTIMEWKVRD